MSETLNNNKMNTEDEKYVCVLCLNSFSTRYVSEDGIEPPAAYFLENWNFKGDCVRVCYFCFTYG